MNANDDYTRSWSSTTVTHHHPLYLCLGSASSDNTFAPARLGSLCEDNMLVEEMTIHAKDFVCRLRPEFQLPRVLRQREEEDDDDDDSTMRFWLEGAVHRNSLA
jgi:hypothetical protein